MITKKQFDILTALSAGGANCSQRELAQRTDMSIGSVNRTLAQLAEAGLADRGGMTEAGLAALEPFRVKKAVILAAGFGSRLVPITLNTPKPLVRVGGRRIIDPLLDAILAVGITDITIVRGYLSEQFDQLLYRYPGIKFIENPVYNEANNISSAFCARFELQNAYVCEADLIINNPAVITRYQYGSNYLGVPVAKTDDWCFHTANGLIRKVAIGGEDCFHMFGISYWTASDGARLAEDIKRAYDAPGGKERYWDQVPLEYFIRDYDVFVRPCEMTDITEIDTFGELKRIDSTYDI